ncbi:hypothetical protein BU15DRAFT_53372 [Melanogaster broomeanus]|nr:hypothetical protein BU15DRAFT_53372 [Melanogaster broomeanus]
MERTCGLLSSSDGHRPLNSTEYLTAVHAILGTSLLYFGKLIGKSPSLAFPGEPTTSLPLWLSALDVFETGSNLPGRTSGSYFLEQDWLLAISGSRVLVAMIDLLLTEEENNRPTSNFFAPDTKWAPNSPLGAITSRRPPPTHRMALSLMSPSELTLVAADQFMRGILHMPHRETAYFPRFSRTDELLTIATEVLGIVERFPEASARKYWAAWVQSILKLIKPEMATEGQLDQRNLAQARCRSFMGTGEGIESSRGQPIA